VRRLVNLGNGLLLILAWLHGLAALYLSLLSGLTLVLAAGLGLAWTLLLLAVLRASLAGPARWRKLLPAAVAVLSVAATYQSVESFRTRYREQHGPPRRYYTR
jgi:CHASE2 domain-containing sensor protein